MIIEKWDILDEQGLPTGKTTLRGKNLLKNGEYHLVVHIWIVSADGKILLQKRSEKKRLMPGEWAATGGAAIAGEDSFAAASRELYEELGLKRSRDKMQRAFRLKRRNSLVDVWFTHCDMNTEEITIQKDEVAEVKWADTQELESMIKEGLFHNYGNEYFSRIFDKIESFKGAYV